jgi:hypothetical protein
MQKLVKIILKFKIKNKPTAFLLENWLLKEGCAERDNVLIFSLSKNL